MVIYTIQEFKVKVKIFYLEQRCNGEPSSSCSIGSTSSSEEVQPLDLLDGFLLEEAMISNAVLNSSAHIVSSATSLKLLPLLGERESLIRKKNPQTFSQCREDGIVLLIKIKEQTVITIQTFKAANFMTKLCAESSNVKEILNQKLGKHQTKFSS